MNKGAECKSQTHATRASPTPPALNFILNFPGLVSGAGDCKSLGSLY